LALLQTLEMKVAGVGCRIRV